MINCIMKKGNHRNISCSFFLWVSVVIVLLTFSAPAFCYEINGTATGNLLSGGYAAKTDDFSASADVENGYALVVEKDGKTVTADNENAQFINICGDKVYYTTIDGIARETILRCYDVSSESITDLYAVPIDEGMKNLFVLDDTAYFQSNGIIKSYRLDTGSVATVKGSGEIAAFVPGSNFLLYTVYDDGSLPLYAYDLSTKTTTVLAKQVTTFDVHDHDVYYSDGENGLYRISLNGGSAKEMAKGTVNQIVCNDTAVYWQGSADDAITSLSYGETGQDVQKVDDYTSFSVLGNDIETVDEPYVNGGSSAVSSIQLSSLPDGTYKSWKQWDSRWKNIPLGSSTETIGSAGCFVTSIAILLVGSGAKSSLDFDPGEFVKQLNNNVSGAFTPTGGFYYYKVTSIAPSFKVKTDTRDDGTGFSSKSKNDKISTIASYLASGYYVVANVKNGGHFVAVDNVSDGVINICDPGKANGDLYAGYGDSLIRLVVFEYTGTPWANTVATPSISLSGKQVTITAASGAKIYYTTDGTTPTTSSTEYTAPFTLSYSKNVRAIAVCENYNNSAVASKDCILCTVPFTDLTADWYRLPVAQVYERNVFNGTSATTFSPNDNTTRADFVTVMGRLSDKDLDNYYYGFTDVNETKYYASSINWAASQGIVTGVTDCTFCPDQYITREQACVIMIRFADVMGISLTATQSAISFSDSGSISSYAKDAVTTAQRAGLINGKGNNLFDPQGKATRAEIAAIIARLIDKM